MEECDDEVKKSGDEVEECVEEIRWMGRTEKERDGWTMRYPL